MDITQKTLDKNKFDFIICYNNDIYLQECVDYISFLNVPEGIEIDIISIAGAESMAAGYNAAMNSSTAKYKVYLHQDTFILNENFISEVINIFENNPEYGLLGVIGHDKLEPDANYWGGHNVGTVIACNAGSTFQVGKDVQELEEVLVIDGMIMITQYDIPWREDIFDGFDFYDVSQSVEFGNAGLKIGIPRQNGVWCMHDCGLPNVKKYDYYRQIFCREYENLGYDYNEDETNSDIRVKLDEAEKYYTKLCKVLKQVRLKKYLK